ncbi:hypothetical protein GGR53DRAFT_358041 [Hypoxylon sp. FL1150]|nr:hypothetical protein GGR53DRAFT_358041 [Hypoxylon sp. FL1150]
MFNSFSAMRLLQQLIRYFFCCNLGPFLEVFPDLSVAAYVLRGLLFTRLIGKQWRTTRWTRWTIVGIVAFLILTSRTFDVLYVTRTRVAGRPAGNAKLTKIRQLCIISETKALTAYCQTARVRVLVVGQEKEVFRRTSLAARVHHLSSLSYADPPGNIFPADLNLAP